MNYSEIETLIQATNFLNNKNYLLAEKIINENYPFVPTRSKGRHYTIKQMVAQFFRDGFIDRYTGNRLLNPGILRILSEFLPNAFPYQAHGKTDECHIAYWDYQPTIDHIYPVSLGGKDTPENWATTSMRNNLAKSNSTLEQIGWTLKSPGDIHNWDGLSKTFIEIVEENPSLLKINRIKNYYIATKNEIKQLF